MTELIQQLRSDFNKNLVQKLVKEFNAEVKEQQLDQSCYIEVDKVRFCVKELKFVVDVYVQVLHCEISCYTLDSGSDPMGVIEHIGQELWEAHLSVTNQINTDYDEACKEEHAWLWETEAGLAARVA
jgi:hypothetical protein